MRTLSLLAALLLGSPAAAHDALLRANNLAAAKSFLTFLGYTDTTLLTPYAQGKIGNVTYFLVFSGAGTGNLFVQNGTHVDGFGNTVPTLVAYDTGLWGYIRYQGDLGTFRLPSGIQAVLVDGKAVVATGGDGVTTITDTFDAVPTTATQPPAAAIATATGIM